MIVLVPSVAYAFSDRIEKGPSNLSWSDELFLLVGFIAVILIIGLMASALDEIRKRIKK